MTISKDELLGQIENAKNNFIIGNAGVCALLAACQKDLLKSSTFTIGSRTVEAQQVCSLLGSEADRNIALKEFVLGLYRAIIKETYELIQSYAGSSDQRDAFRNAENYHFWRMVRNAVSHDAHWHFNPHDLRQLPLKWRGAVLAAEMQGQPFAIAFLGYEGLFGLFEDMAHFATSVLR